MRFSTSITYTYYIVIDFIICCWLGTQIQGATLAWQLTKHFRSTLTVVLTSYWVRVVIMQQRQSLDR